MVDLHCHLLPGIDDGASDLDESLALARIALDDGITHMVCTPHMHPGRHDNTAETIHCATLALRAALAEAGLPLQLGMATELRFSIENLAALKAGRVPLVGALDGKGVVLLEFPHGELPFGAERLTARLLQMDIVPLIAHPERNKTLLRDPARIRPLLAQGCLLQLTAGSITGHFGAACQALSLQWLHDDMIFVVASDAHNVEHRPPILSRARDFVASRFGPDRAERLFLHNPAMITKALFA